MATDHLDPDVYVPVITSASAQILAGMLAGGMVRYAGDKINVDDMEQSIILANVLSTELLGRAVQWCCPDEDATTPGAE